MLRWFHLPRLGRETATQKHSSHGNVDTACHLHDPLPLKNFYNQATQTRSAVLIFSSAFTIHMTVNIQRFIRIRENAGYIGKIMCVNSWEAV